MKKIKEIAKRRLKEIELATVRIKAKIESMPDDPRKEAWEKRLAEYEISKASLAIELKSGVAVKVKDKKQQQLIAAMRGGDQVPSPTGGVTVPVPAGDLSMEGK